jgi:hypothetical protein
MNRFEKLGMLMYRLLSMSGAERNNGYALLKRVFDEQYELICGPGGGKKKHVKSRKKSEISAKSVQNPHDPECEYRNKGGTKVKGYSVNVTETCDEGNLNLIVGVQVEGCGTSDVEYLEGGIENAQEIVAGKIEEAYTDGAYHSPDNQKFCKGEEIDWVLRGIQGKPSIYDLSFNEDGELVVQNTQSGELLETRKVNTRDPEAPDRWAAKDENNNSRYFEQKNVETCELRKRLDEIPKERLDIRNNVEATLFQIGYHYPNDKSRYRGLVKHAMWALSRCIWVNFRRIQLWNTRKAGDSENGGAGISKENVVSIFLRIFLSCFLGFFRCPLPTLSE